MQMQPSRELIENSDIALKAVLSKYGVKDSDLAFCTAEILIVVLGILTKIEEIAKDAKDSR